MPQLDVCRIIVTYLICLFAMKIRHTEAALEYSSVIAREFVETGGGDQILETEVYQYWRSEVADNVVKYDNHHVGHEDGNFSVYWNAPTESCLPDFGVHVDPKRFGIKENKLNGWVGNEITIFYASQLGLYPEIDSQGRAINGGVPQLGNYDAHIAKATRDIKRDIPRRKFAGLGIIDWEPWNPVWDRNWDSKKPYRDLSVTIVRSVHPDWSEEKLEAEAKVQFEAAAKRWMLGTLRLAKALRPLGQWGFYLFPKCYNKVEKTCPEKEMKLNEQLLWLFNETTALYPSAYLKDASLTQKEKANKVYGRVAEAKRMRSLVSERFNKTMPIYVYNRFRYINGSLYSKADIIDTVAQPKTMGIEGSVLWDNHDLSENRTACTYIKRYVDTTLGPTVRKILDG